MIYKLVVVSDIHRAGNYLLDIMPVINAADYFIFCGDGLDELMALRGGITVPMLCVKGNNDRNTNIGDMASIVLGDTKVLVTHGDRQDVRRGLGVLYTAAKLKNCSLVFFGHTHNYCDYVQDGIHFINPGALNEGSYAIVVGDGRNFNCSRAMVPEL